MSRRATACRAGHPRVEPTNADTDYVEFKEFDISEYADTAAKIAVNIVKRM